MKILMVSNILYPLGGVETYMISLGEYYKKIGHEVQYFGMQDTRNTVTNSYGIYVKNIDFRTKSLKKILYPFRIIYSIEARRKIRKLLKIYKPDVVHLNTINFNITPSIIYEIRKFHIPIIKTIHDAQIACPNHRLFIEHEMKPCTACIKGKYSNCIKNKCIWNSRSKSIIAAFESYLYHGLKIYEKIDRYIVPSEFMKGIHVANGISSDKMSVILNYSRMDIDSNVKTTQFSKSEYVLYFGRISAEKGIYTLLEACKSLTHIKFVFAGVGPLLTSLAGYDNVHALGFKSGTDLQSIIEKALFSVYPSEWYENSPLSVVESQALGTPVIGADIGGIPELIKNGETGILFRSGDLADLKEKIEYLFDNRDILNQMTKKCITDSGIVNLDQYAKQMVSLYDEEILIKRR
jgi:glycosyltransferase involved in cell wall biosynthesis